MIYFCNDQWAVTDQGLEHQGFPEYTIPAGELASSADFGTDVAYHWPVHMSSKTWVNVDLFFTAFLYGLVHHAGAYAGSMDAVMLRDTLALARAVAPKPGEK